VLRILKDTNEVFRRLKLGWLILGTLTIMAFVFGIYEVLEQNLFKETDPVTVHYLFITRGIMMALLMAAWTLWTIYHFHTHFEFELEATESRYRNIVENSVDAIITIDNEGHIASWNKGAENIFGWEAAEVQGKPSNILIPHKLRLAGEEERLARIVTQRGFVKSYQTERLHKSGRIVPVSLTETLLRSRGEILGRAQIIRDLSETRQLEHQMRQSERLITAGNLAAGIAHEIGNPLTAISSLVQLLARKTNDEWAKEKLAQIRTNIERISKIVRQLVEFTRPQSAEVSMVQVNEVIEGAVGLMQYDKRSRRFNTILDLAEDLPPIKASPDKLHQVIINLLVNAYDAMQEKGDTVRISTSHNERHIVITVEDNGQGMTPEIKDKIFEPFFTTKEIGKGTGLGLSVSHGIIQSMGGEILVDSKAGEGTTFTIKIPKGGS